MSEITIEDIENDESQFLTPSIHPHVFDLNSSSNYFDSQSSISQRNYSRLLSNMTTNIQTIDNPIFSSDEHESDSSEQHPIEADDHITHSESDAVRLPITATCTIDHSLENSSTDDDEETVFEDKCISTIVSDETNIPVEESIERPQLGYSLSVCCSYDTSQDEVTVQTQLIESCASAFTGVDSKKNPDSLGHIMISYNHSTRILCMKIAQELRRRRYSVWIDQDNISGNIFTAMASAIENSFVVLMAINEAYFHSRYCKLEAEYSVEQNKAVVPMLMQTGYKPSGWLGIISGAKLRVDFAQLPFATAFGLLLKEIEGVLGDSDIQKDHSTLSSSCVENSSATTMMLSNGRSHDVTDWNADDVIDWLHDKQLEIFERPLTNFTGATLWELYKVKFDSASDYYRMVETLLPLDQPGRLFKILTFHSELEKLFASTLQTIHR